MNRLIRQFRDLDNAVNNSNEVFNLRKRPPPIEEKTSKTNKMNSLGQFDKFSRTELLLSGWEMIDENFPVPIEGLLDTKFVGYVNTKDRYEDVTSSSPMFGVDCEMCMTANNEQELTRISIVDECYKVIYEQLVKPDNNITNYLTKYSGITPAMMKGVTKRLEDVQVDLQKLLPRDAILVGHSLSNDLHAMKMFHPYIIDTSVIFNMTGDRKRKTKLKTLMEYHLNETIQKGNEGHCSIEDSASTMKLAKLKLSKSVYFGDTVMFDGKYQMESCPELGNPNFGISMLRQVTKVDKNAVVVGCKEVIHKYNYYVFKNKSCEHESIKMVKEEDDNEIVQRLCESMQKFTLNIAHVRPGNCERLNFYAKVNRWVEQIVKQSKKPSLHIIIFEGQGHGPNGCCFIKLNVGNVIHNKFFGKNSKTQ